MASHTKFCIRLFRPSKNFSRPNRWVGESATKCALLVWFANLRWGQIKKKKERQKKKKRNHRYMIRIQCVWLLFCWIVLCWNLALCFGPRQNAPFKCFPLRYFTSFFSFLYFIVKTLYNSSNRCDQRLDVSAYGWSSLVGYRSRAWT